MAKKKDRSFVCTHDDCSKSYSRLAHLKRHAETHGGNYRCSDEECGMKFKSKYTLKKHVDNIHLKKNPKKYKCQDCGEDFNMRSWLTSHRYYKHTGVKPYACSEEGCDAKFLHPGKLKRHMTVHAGLRYTCSKENCGAQFSKWTEYCKHLSSAHPLAFKCNICEKEFLRSNNLKAHLETHQSDREVFLCPLPNCGRFYYLKRNLTHHLKKNHDKRILVRTEKLCSKSSKTRVKQELDADPPQQDLSRQKQKESQDKYNPCILQISTKIKKEESSSE